jgi:hypothetical protein
MQVRWLRSRKLLSIRLMVRRQISRCARNDPELGMFLWVQLVLATLESVYSVTEMQRAVEGVPEGLDKVLEGLIRSVLAHANVALDMTAF